MTPLAADLFAAPWKYHFMAAGRALQRLDPLGRTVGRAAGPDGEAVRFRGRPSLAFAPAALSAASPADGDEPAELTVAFLNLFWTNGALPLYWTERLLDAAAEPHHDTALRDFLDLFNHRLLALFYRASAVGHPGLEYEAWRRGESPGPDGVTRYVLDLLGADPPEGVPTEALTGYAGLWLCAPSRSALERLLGDYFQAPVRVAPMRHEDGSPGRFRLEVGPLAWERYRAFLPGGNALAPLLRMTRLAVGAGLAFDVELRLRADEAPESTLGGDGEAGLLEWTSWLPGGEGDYRCGVLSRNVSEAVERGDGEG